MDYQFKKGDVVIYTPKKYCVTNRGTSLKWSAALRDGEEYKVTDTSPSGEILLEGETYWHNSTAFTLKKQDMKLEITKEKVLEAASKCSTAKATLKTLFPEVFEDKKVQISAITTIFEDKAFALIETRDCGKFSFQSFWLNPVFDWKIEEDDLGTLCLIPTRK